MNINELTPSMLLELWTDCAPKISQASFLDEAAMALVEGIYKRFEESVVLSRIFFTLPFEVLPQRQKQFATNLAGSVGFSTELSPRTPILSLLATWGGVAEWTDPQKSKGHIAIPLLSEGFVASIPMVSRLLKELGLPLTWVHDAGTAMTKQTLGSEAGLFYVADALTATDEQNRKIIAAQDFVLSQKIGSVFAVGGVYFGGCVLVLITFCRQPVEHRVARVFMPLVNFFKSSTTSQFSLSRVFHPTPKEHGVREI